MWSYAFYAVFNTWGLQKILQRDKLHRRRWRGEGPTRYRTPLPEWFPSPTDLKNAPWNQCRLLTVEVDINFPSFQGRTIAGVHVLTLSCEDVLLLRLLITAIGWCLNVCHKKNTDTSWRQFFRRWTVSLELSACRITWQRYLTCTV